MKEGRGVSKQPLWDGGELEGQRILLWTEQGAGDFIQFSRYIPLVEKKGGAVILEVPAGMSRLARWFPGNFQITPSGSYEVFDVHCALMSLPRSCEEHLSAVAPPLVWSVPEKLRREWGARRAPKQRKSVALIWAGNPAHSEDRHRSIQLELFKPLFAARDVTYFSLQVGMGSEQIQNFEFASSLRNLAPLCTDYAETAAALTQMDLVISVDTSVAHLAGSLGLTTWLLLPFAPDWRWLLEREDSPWYPSMRLFRQVTPGDWKSVIERVAVELQENFRTPASLVR